MILLWGKWDIKVGCGTGTQAGPEKMVLQKMLILYSPAQKTIAFSDTPTWTFTPFTGEIMTASPTVKQ